LPANLHFPFVQNFTFLGLKVCFVVLHLFPTKPPERVRASPLTKPLLPNTQRTTFIQRMKRILSDKKNIPVRSLCKAFGNGIAIAKISSDTFRSDEEAKHPRRHDYHFLKRLIQK